MLEIVLNLFLFFLGCVRVSVFKNTRTSNTVSLETENREMCNNPPSKELHVLSADTSSLAAVYRRCLSHLFGRYKSLAEVPKKTIAIRGLWRTRCKELVEAGWKLPIGQHLEFTTNCPTVGLTLTRMPSVRACSNRIICPWCWCRSTVRTLWRRICAEFFPSDGLGLMATHSIIETFVEMRLPDEEYDIPACLKVMQDNKSRMAKFFRGHIAPQATYQAGGAWCQTFEPAMIDRHDGFSDRCRVVTLRQLAIVPKWTDNRSHLVWTRLNQKPEALCTVRNHIDINRRLMEEIIARTYRYPTLLLDRRCVERTAAILNAMQGHRLTTQRYGCLRQADEVEAI